MKYKILMVKNRFTDKFKYDRGIDWLKKNTPLEIEISELKTDLDLSFEEVSNATYKGVAVTDAVKEKLRTLIPEKTYNLIVFLYGNKAPGIRVSMADINPLYADTDFVEVVMISDGGKTMNHEMFHSFFAKLRRRGIYLPDPMDSCIYDGKVQPYFNNDNMDAVPSNRSIALGLLAPHWATVASINMVTVPTPPANTSPYKYFSKKEVDTFKLKPELWEILDKARGNAGVPFVLTSGLRTPDQNTAVGGVANSVHLRGLAADLSCTNNIQRYKMVRGLLAVGVPMFVELAQKHIHVDIDSTIHSMDQIMLSDDD